MTKIHFCGLLAVETFALRAHLWSLRRRAVLLSVVVFLCEAAQ
jgi:hypothetical protein